MTFDPKLLYTWHKFAEKNGGDISLYSHTENNDADKCIIQFDYKDFPISVVFEKTTEKSPKISTKYVSPLAEKNKKSFQIHASDSFTNLAAFFMRSNKMNNHRIFSRDKKLIEFISSHFAFKRLTMKYLSLEMATIKKISEKDGYFPFKDLIRERYFVYSYSHNHLIGEMEHLELLLVLFFDLQGYYLANQ